MRIVTRRLSLLVTGDLLSGTTAQDLAEHVAGTSACDSNGVLLPGCPVVQNVTVTEGRDGEVTLAAEFLASDRVASGDYAGQEVTEEFVTEYVMGAGEYWCGAGDTFSPSRAQALRTQ